MADPVAKPLIVIDAADQQRPILPPDMWAYRSLLAQMTLGAFRQKYLHLKTSFLWYYVRPAVITLVFVLLRANAQNTLGADAPYPVFVLTGVCFWFIFADTLEAAAGALARDASLIQKVYFPILISPVAHALARLGDIVLALIAIFGLQIVLGVGIDWEILLLVPVIAQLLLLAIGLGCTIAALAITAPDIREGIGVALLLGLFLSPVFYAPSAMPGAAQLVLHVNPMAGTLGAIRGALFDTTAFPWALWGVSCAFTAAALALGFVLLARVSRNVAENL